MSKSPYPMIPIEDALAHIERHVKRLPIVSMPFEQALGLVLAEDVFADEPMPPFPAAAVDGYAVIAENGPGWHRIVGDQMAGYIAEIEVTSGTAARVTTGAPIPPGATAMIMIEETEEQDGRVNIKTDPIEVGAYIRPIGLDIQQGQQALAEGTQLGPAELGLLATVGRTNVEVYRRPVVAVMSTGDEIVEPHEIPERGQIRDSNRFTLMSLVKQTGATVLDMGIISDKQHRLESQIETALTQADMLMTSGGVSMGQLDLVKPYFAQRGTIHFGRVNTKPGKPVTFATVDGVPCFGMPGFPVSAMVSFEIFVYPALRTMMGHPDRHHPRQKAMLEHTFRHAPYRTEFHRVNLYRNQEGQLTATSTGFQGSGRLLSMVEANGFVILPHGKSDYETGSMVEAVLLEII
ncbi:molybdopterin molybdotransferase MoeA [Anaerolineales bacterium HSG24]|nr:molybdopterin molybdotransferase MoeA [Anaerolineales bacterium HSG24]